MKRKKPRRLWLNVKAKSVPGVSREEFKAVLVQSIERGDYVLPSGWQVVLEWRNKESAKMKAGYWTDELLDSSVSSDGFDKAVLSWLKGKRT